MEKQSFYFSVIFIFIIMSLTPAIPTGAPVIQPPTFGSTFSACAPNDTPSAFATTEPLSHIASDSVPDEDTLCYGFQAAKSRYTDLVFYLQKDVNFALIIATHSPVELLLLNKPYQ